MVEYYFSYSDGKSRYIKFPSYKEAADFAHQEGDHLIDWGVVKL